MSAMRQEDADGTGVATVVDKPTAAGQATAKGEATVVMPEGPPTGTGVPKPRAQTAPTVHDLPHDRTVNEQLSSAVANLTLTTAHDALHDEEIERTRLFIRLGWVISIGAIAIVPLLPSPLAMQIAMVAAMLFGMAGSFVYHQRFADPAKYSERALAQLATMCIVNAHVAVLYFGVFTMAPVIVVIGTHFVGRTEAVRVGRWMVGFALFSYAVVASLIIGGVFADPGVFASARPLSTTTQLIGTAFVLGMYWLGYVTGKMFRETSLVA